VRRRLDSESCVGVLLRNDSTRLRHAVTSRGVWGQTAKYVIDKHPRLCFATNDPEQSTPTGTKESPLEAERDESTKEAHVAPAGPSTWSKTLVETVESDDDNSDEEPDEGLSERDEALSEGESSFGDEPEMSPSSLGRPNHMRAKSNVADAMDI
jgi:hypothetical protein